MNYTESRLKELYGEGVIRSEIFNNSTFDDIENFEGFEGCNFNNCTFGNIQNIEEFEGCNFNNCKFRGIDSVDFKNCYIKNCVIVSLMDLRFTNTTIKNLRFDVPVLKDEARDLNIDYGFYQIEFVSVDFNNCSIIDVVATNISFSTCNFTDTQISNFIVNSKHCNTYMHNCKFVGSSIRNSNFNNLVTLYCKFINFEISDTKLEIQDLYEHTPSSIFELSSFHNSTMKNVIMSTEQGFLNSRFSDTQFVDCIMNYVRISCENEEENDINFTNCELNNARISNIKIKRFQDIKKIILTNFDTCSFENVIMSKDTEFLNCQFSAQFIECKMNSVKLSGVYNENILNLVKFIKCDLDNAIISHVNIQSILDIPKMVSTKFYICSFENVDFINCDMESVDFDSSTVGNCVFDKSNLNKIKVINTTFNISSFNNGSMTNSDLLISTKFYYCAFNDFKIIKCETDHIEMFDTDFNNSEIVDSNFNDAIFKNGTLGISVSNSEMIHITFIDTDLHNGSIKNTKMPSTTFEDCNFDNFEFIKCNMNNLFFVGQHYQFESCKIENCKLNYAVLSNMFFESKIFNDLEMNGIQLTNCTYNDCSFLNCKMNGSKFINNEFQNNTFRYASLDKTTFENCKFNGDIFKKCSIKNSKYSKSNIFSVHFDESDLSEFIMSSCKLNKNVKFLQSNLSHSNFILLDLNEVEFYNCSFDNTDIVDCANIPSLLLTDKQVKVFVNPANTAVQQYNNPLEDKTLDYLKDIHELPLETINFNEKLLPDSCDNFMLDDDYRILLKDHFMHSDRFIFVNFNKDANEYNISCWDKENVEMILKHRNTNLFYKCMSDSMRSVDTANIYVKLNIPHSVYVDIRELKSVLTSTKKVFYIVPCPQGSSFVEFSVSWGVLNGVSRFTSAYHCQHGSSLYLYNIKICEGMDCLY